MTDELFHALDAVWQGIAPDAISSWESAGEEMDYEAAADTLGDCLQTYLSAEDYAKFEELGPFLRRELLEKVTKAYF